jgi:hypothetical protein
VRVQRVRLEDHCDVAAPRREVGDLAVADPDLTGGHVLEAGEHPQERRLAAPGRPDEDEEFAVLDVQGDPVHRRHGAEGLRHFCEPDLRHLGRWYRPARTETSPFRQNWY